VTKTAIFHRKVGNLCDAFWKGDLSAFCDFQQLFCVREKVRNRSSLQMKITKTIQMGSSGAMEFGEAHQNLNFEAHSRILVTMTLAGQEKLGKKLGSPMAIPLAPIGGSFPNTVKRGKG
jgi:hypothetical protein